MRVHYAMKCNPDHRLLAHLRGLGCKFEIASRSELDALRAIEVEPRSVLFSNPVRHAMQTRHAAAMGVYRFAFDSEDELASLAQNAPGASVYVRLATEGADSKVRSEGKFGVSVATAASLMLRARASGLCPYGIAFHVGSQVEQPELWRAAIRDSAELMRRLDVDGIRVAMLNIGGGYPAFHRAGLPSIAEIAAVIRTALATELPFAPEVLVIEPGRGLVSDAGVMVSTVIGVARRCEKTWVHLDLGGFTLLEALESRHTLDYPVADSVRSKTRMTSHITAATCDSMDTIVYDNRAFSADLERGDRVSPEVCRGAERREELTVLALAEPLNITHFLGLASAVGIRRETRAHDTKSLRLLLDDWGRRGLVHSDERTRSHARGTCVGNCSEQRRRGVD